MGKKRYSHFRDSIFYTSLIMLVGLLIALVPLFYTLSANLLRRSAEDYTEQLLLQVNNSINYYITEMIDISDYLIRSQDVIAFLNDEDPLAESKVHDQLATIDGIRPDLVHLLVFRIDGHMVSGVPGANLNPNWDYRRMVWYNKTLEAQGRPVMSSSRVENLIEGEYPWVVSLSRSLYVDGVRKGMLLINLNYQQISDICNSLSYDDQGYVYIIGSDNRLVYHPQQQLVYSGIKSERLDMAAGETEPVSDVHDGLIYTSLLSEDSSWTLVSVFDTSQLVAISPLQTSLYIGITLVFAILAFLMSYIASKKLTDPILSLKHSMKRFEQGDLDAKATLNVHNEISELGDQFNVMTDRIKQMVQQSIEIEKQKRLSELQSLQAQIRPHFLYNTLESIIWMAELGQKDNVIEMTSSLSKLLRASVNRAGSLVSLETEIDYVRHYIKIQKMRYQDKLECQIDVNPDVLQAKVLGLIIQPLVENAIYHGIKPLKAQGLIRLSAYASTLEAVKRKEDLMAEKHKLNPPGEEEPGYPDGLLSHLDHLTDNPENESEPSVSASSNLPLRSFVSKADDTCLVIEISDNGVGFSRLIKAKVPDFADGQQGIGLSNVENRIKLYFGPRYGLRIKSEQNVSGKRAMKTMIQLILPLILEERQQHET